MTGRWIKRLFGAILILLLPLLVGLTWLAGTESGLRWTYRQALPYLPGELRVKDLQGRLLGTIRATGIDYRQGDVHARARQLALQWRPGELLTGAIHVSHLQLTALDVTLPPAAEQPSTAMSMTLPDINLPWRVVLKDTHIRALTLQHGENRYHLAALDLDASSLFGRIDIQQLGIAGQGFSMDLSGVLHPTGGYKHDLDLDWRRDLPSGAVLRGTGRIRGSVRSTHMTQQLSGPVSLELTADAQDLLQALEWQAKARVSAFDLVRIRGDWPPLAGSLQLEGHGDLDTATLSGSADTVYGDQGTLRARFRVERRPAPESDPESTNRLHIQELVIEAPAPDTRLSVAGTWRPGPDGGQVDLDLDWRNLRWPLDTGAWFHSAEGQGRINGRFDDYALSLTTTRPWPEAPPSDWSGQARGDPAGLDIDRLRVRTLDGEARVSGRLSWSPHFSWQARGQLEGINPGTLVPRWPGRLNGELTSSGRLKAGRWQAEADISQIKGRLRGYPVVLQTRLAWREQGLDIEDLRLGSGESRVRLQGRVADDLRLEGSVDTLDMGELYPGTGGQLSVEGRLQGPRAAPRVDARFSGQALHFRDFALGRVDGEIDLDLSRWHRGTVQLTAETLKLGGVELDSLKLDGNARDFEADAVSAAFASRIELHGQPTDTGWTGHIRQAQVHSEPFGNWQLTRPAALILEGRRISMEQACWTTGSGQLCAELNGDPDNWQSRLSAHALPLQLLGPWLPPHLRLEGQAEASADMRYTLPDGLRGQVTIDLAEGAVSYPLLRGPERDRWDYRNARLDITLDDAGVSMKTRLLAGNGDRLHGNLSLPGARLPGLDRETQPLRGDMGLDIQDLGIIEALLPDVHDLTGRLEIALNARGTLGSPRLEGKAQLHEGALRIPRLGLTIEPFTLTARSDDRQRLTFRGEARSGEGQLGISGETRLDPDAGWPTRLSIQGTDFQVAQIPEARVDVSPALDIRVENRSVHVSGKVHVPYARLQPRDITTAARVSEDAVIVGGDQAAEKKWHISSKVRVTLGDRVSFYGFGFEGRFGGNLVLHDQPGQVTTATGTIKVEEGRYRAYGQRLEVEQGKLLYTGGPLDNPGLDLRAERQVNNVTAGLRVRGTLRRPEVELFSIPAMGQTDALSYLLLGRPLETASGDEGGMMAKAALALSLSSGDRLARVLGGRFGLDEFRVESSESGEQASLVIGRYLSPRLYVSYGVGLIESFNTLNVRYQISDHWQLKGESGEHQGADLLYTIER